MENAASRGIFHFTINPCDCTRGRLLTLRILVSFAIDALGILAALVMPGGIWIC